MENMNKLVLSMVIISITLIIGVFITSTMSTSFKTSTTGTVNNETLSAITQTGTNLAVSSYDTVSCSILSVTNATAATLINSANYTLSGCTLAVAADVNAPWNNTNWNVTYSYTYLKHTNSSNAADAAGSALNSGTNWLAIVIVVGFAVIILILLNKGLGGSKGGESGGEVYEMQAY